MRRISTRLVLGAAAVAAAAAGTAVAAAQRSSPNEGTSAVLESAARELGVEPAALRRALRNALAARVDAAVAAGQLTEAQGERLKERLEAGDGPLFAPLGRRFHGARGAKLDAAASYLGVTAAELREALRGGKSLADVAREQEKPVEGLVDALVEAARERIDAAVAAGRLPEERKDELLARLRERVEALVDGDAPRRQFGS